MMRRMQVTSFISALSRSVPIAAYDIPHSVSAILLCLKKSLNLKYFAITIVGLMLIYLILIKKMKDLFCKMFFSLCSFYYKKFFTE